MSALQSSLQMRRIVYEGSGQKKRIIGKSKAFGNLDGYRQNIQSSNKTENNHDVISASVLSAAPVRFYSGLLLGKG